LKYDLEPAKEVLKEFFAEIENDKTNLDPNLEENAYKWLYAEPQNYRVFMHQPKPYSISEYYTQPALPIYRQWRGEEKEVFSKQCEQIPLFLLH
jgi:hypothetical protein